MSQFAPTQQNSSNQTSQNSSTNTSQFAPTQQNSSNLTSQNNNNNQQYGMNNIHGYVKLSLPDVTTDYDLNTIINNYVINSLI